RHQPPSQPARPRPVPPTPSAPSASRVLGGALRRKARLASRDAAGQVARPKLENAMATSIDIGVAPEGPQTLALKRANRHGLIAGATGTGKTVTLQVLAEEFA